MADKYTTNKNDIISHLKARSTGIGIQEDNKYISIISVSYIMI
mgnify:CR=1 FL=1